VHRTLMRLYEQHGRRGAALRQYQACVTVLRKELGIEPEPGTRALYHRLLQSPASAKTAAGEAVAAAGTARRAGARTPDFAHETPLTGRERAVRALDGAFER